jgi:cob(I)alamin adenosyltransferase
MSFKIYTKTGDKGRTSLLGGQKVPKSHIRIEAYGNSDELNAFIGYLRDHEEINEHYQRQLKEIQEVLFTMGSQLAMVPGFSGFEIPKLKEEQLHHLENWIDEMDESLPPLKNFILPGGHKAVSLSHICRTICRRVERSVTVLHEEEGTDPLIIPYLNRLSDYFFVLGRKLASDLNAPEIPWKPE